MDYLESGIDRDYWMSPDAADDLRGLKMLDSILPSSWVEDETEMKTKTKT